MNIKINSELLAIGIVMSSLNGAYAYAKKNITYICDKKHIVGKNIPHRIGKLEQQYGKNRGLIGQLIQIKLTQQYLVKSELIKKNNSLEENLNNLGYTMEELKIELSKFKKKYNIYKIEKVRGGRYAIQLFKGI